MDTLAIELSKNITENSIDNSTKTKIILCSVISEWNVKTSLKGCGVSTKISVQSFFGLIWEPNISKYEYN